jgi:glycosyltransferase involved in cell wall biosynthesis
VSATAPTQDPQTKCPFVSVIVPVYNDADRLARCLASLDAQTVPRAGFENIVVDNGSTDRPAAVVAAFPDVRLLHEPTPGSYAARNTGLSVARGQVIAFTDSDCVPDVHWLERGTGALREAEGCGLVGGAVRITRESPGPATTCELYESIFDFDQRRFVALGKFASTANVFTYASVLRRVGPFCGAMKSGGDREWGNRVESAGYRLVFAETAVVSHPSRETVGELLAKRLRVAGGHHQLARMRTFPALRFLVAVGRHVVTDPFWGAVRVWRNAPAVELGGKLRLVCLYVFLSYAQAIERVRLQLGGAPRR